MRYCNQSLFPVLNAKRTDKHDRVTLCFIGWLFIVLNLSLYVVQNIFLTL